MKKNNLVVTLADGKFVDQAKQLFSGIYFNSGWNGDYMLLSHNISEDELNWFKDKGILIYHCSSFIEYSEIGVYPQVVYDKFYLFTTEFKKWDNIVFLDADIIVRGSIQNLTKVKGFSAVRDSYFNKLKDQFRPDTHNKIIQSGYNLSLASFNSGVMAFSTSIIKDNSFDELLSLYKGFGNYCNYGEQPILNLYFYKSWKNLSGIYNTFVNCHQYMLPKKINYVILHFFARDFYPPVWDSKNPYYPEWMLNLTNFKSIDLSIPINNKLNSSFYEFNSNLFLQFHARISKYYYIFQKIEYKLIHFAESIERFIGNIGKYIKKRNEKLYFKLRAIIFRK